MDHNLSQVSKRSDILEKERHNGRTCQTGIVILDPLLEKSNS